MMVRTAEAGEPTSAPPVGPLSARLIVSFGSSDESSVTATVNVLGAVSPFAHVRVPDAAA
jgi:hypothetical protein